MSIGDIPFIFNNKVNEGPAAALDAGKIRREAKRLLEAAEYNGLQKPRSHYAQMHGNNGWIMGNNGWVPSA